MSRKMVDTEKRKNRTGKTKNIMYSETIGEAKRREKIGPDFWAGNIGGHWSCQFAPLKQFMED